MYICSNYLKERKMIMEKSFEMDLFNFDESFVAKIVAQGRHGVTTVDKGGNIVTHWGGTVTRIFKTK